MSEEERKTIVNGKVSLKTVATVLSIVVCLLGLAGSYYQGRLDRQAAFYEFKIELQKERDAERMLAQEQRMALMGQIEILRLSLDRLRDWTDDSFGKVTGALDDPVREHEYNFHPKTKAGVGPQPTKFEIELDKVPETPEQNVLPALKTQDELGMMMKKKMAAGH